MRMPSLPLRAIAAGCLALAFAGHAPAATTGGVISLSGDATATCNKVLSVPLDTVQETFSQSGSVSCAGGSAGASMYTDASAGKIGLSGYSANSGPILGSSQVSAEVVLFDHWLIKVPVGTPNDTTFTIPVTLHVDGLVTPGTQSRAPNFLTYAMTVRNLYAGFTPDYFIQSTGSVTSTGSYSHTLSGTILFNYSAMGLPPTLEIDMVMGFPPLLDGTIDFYHTASIALDLPAGFTATTSAGTPLIFAAVPEPATGMAFLFGLGLLALKCMRRGSRGKSTPSA